MSPRRVAPVCTPDFVQAPVLVAGREVWIRHRRPAVVARLDDRSADAHADPAHSWLTQVSAARTTHGLWMLRMRVHTAVQVWVGERIVAQTLYVDTPAPVERGRQLEQEVVALPLHLRRDDRDHGVLRVLAVACTSNPQPASAYVTGQHCRDTLAREFKV